MGSEIANPSKLTSIPADIQHQLLGLLPDFCPLGALIRTCRCFHDVYKSRPNLLLDNVAKNFLGCMFDEAMLLARAQETKYSLGDSSVKGLSSNTVLLVVNNDSVVRELEDLLFGLLEPDDDGTFDVEDEDSLAQFVDDPLMIIGKPSPTESIRFQTATYRFWRFFLQPARNRM
ncbi:hypothetical protein C8R44DRAFT_223050 [Mycena epipterygia]|nr:hypothetical protein C8R44DRAFT_223050 [Mycena epipterygia]